MISLSKNGKKIDIIADGTIADNMEELGQLVAVFLQGTYENIKNHLLETDGNLKRYDELVKETKNAFINSISETIKDKTLLEKVQDEQIK